MDLGIERGITRGMRSVIALVALSLVTVWSCGKGNGQGGTNKESVRAPGAKGNAPLTLRDARSILEHSVRDEGSLSAVRAHRFANGDFAYVSGRVSKTGNMPAKIAVDRNGRGIALWRAKQWFTEVHQERWGSVSLPLARKAFASGSTTEIHAYVTTTDTQQVHEQLPGKVQVLSTTTGDGLRIRVPASRVRSLGQLEDVDAVREVVAAEPTAIQGPANYTNADVEFNNEEGIFGTGERVGIYDFLKSGCAIHTSDEAFGSATVDYTDPLEPCEEHSDCREIDCTPGDGENVGKCKWLANSNVVDESAGWFCVVPKNKAHATKVASRIAHRTYNGIGEKLRHAARATLVVYNGEGNHFLDPGEYLEGLQQLADENVTLVNESFGPSMCDPPFGAKAYRRTWAIEEYGFNVVKAAGNVYDDEGPDGNQCTDIDKAETICQATNSICVGATNADSTYHDFSDDDMWSASRYVNPRKPAQSSAWTEWEIEEPDVVSEGAEVRIAGINSTTWSTGSGTSYAAPTVTGLIALLNQYCGWDNANTPTFFQVRNRNLVRAAAHVRQSLEDPTDKIFPTFPPGLDSYAGAGIVEASRLKYFCNTGGSGENGEPDDGGSSGWPGGGGWTDVPPSAEGSSPGEYELYLIEQDDWNQVQGRLNWNGQALQMLRVATLASGYLPALTRVRATMSYAGCPDNTNENGTPPSLMGIDYDLAVCGLNPDCLGDCEDNCEETCFECLLFSTSSDDLNEGFDGLLPSTLEQAGLYAFRSAGTSAPPSCANSSGKIEANFAWKLWNP